MCKKLVDLGKAYATPNGDVYFRVRSGEHYGSLSGRSLDELMAGARGAAWRAKEDPWISRSGKSAKPGEQNGKVPGAWAGQGWHIECSAMTEPYLPLDIHGGGQDHDFSAPRNERPPRARAACGCKLANYWVHNGFVQINSEKMSKSLGNFTTIREILKTFCRKRCAFSCSPGIIAAPLIFTWQGMEEAEKAQKEFIRPCLTQRAR